MSAASAQQAALHILLEDVEPLLQRAEAAATDVQAAREGLAVDLATLTALVQRGAEAPAALLEAARRLDSAAARIEAAAQARQAQGPTAERIARGAHVGQKRSRMGAALLCGASALIGASAAWMLPREATGPASLQAEARLGRALQRGWTSLDAPTRARVEEVLRR